MGEAQSYAVAEAVAVRIASDIDRLGFGVLRNYVSGEDLEPARALAVAAVETAGGEYVCFRDTYALAGTVLAELPKSDGFKDVCRRLYEIGTGEPAPEVEFYQIFRCLKGITGQSHSNRFHYDSYVLTALLPVAVPEEGLRGDLVLVPNTRRIRRLYLLNVLDRFLVGSRIAQAMLRLAARRRSSRVVAIRIEPGTMYFFWGYRSIHTNEPCDVDKLRATALFHYGDPHQNSRVRALTRRARGNDAL